MKNLFLTGLIGLGVFSSCSNEGDPTKDVTLNEGEAYAQIVLNMTDSRTASRAPEGSNTGSTDTGTESEYNVQDLTVVLADANNYIQAIYAADLKTGGSDNSNRATEPFKVPAGQYKVYVLANYESSKEAFSQSLAVGTQFDQAFEIKDASKLNQTGKFLMTNDDLLESVTDFTTDASDTEVDDDLSKETQSPETVHLVKVNIERVVAKVELDQTKTTLDVIDENKTEIADAELQGGALINLNKYMYMVRDAKATNNKPSTASTWIYPEDYNYSKVLDGTSEGEDAWLAANFSNPTASSFTKDLTSATFYCPENTMSAEAQQNGQTTGVVYKVKYTPAATAYTELAKDAISTYDQIFTAILALEDGTKDSEITDDIFSTSEDENGTFFTYNNLIFKNKKAAILYKSIAEATGSSINEKATAANNAFTSNKGKTSETDLDGIKVYKYSDGISYYTAWVKHNPDGGNMEEGKFGVVRNHWYVLTVNSISGLGYHKPTFENPEDPDDPTVSNIQVAATIKPWTIVKQGVDL